MSAGDRLLFLLKTRGPATAGALAERLRISPQAVREQLCQLEADDLVAHDDEASGRGRPKRHWRLTPEADRRFPDTHAELTVDLIAALRAELGEAALDALIGRRERDVAAHYRARLAGCASLEERVATLAALRDAEGYMAEWRRSEDGAGFELIENHCPICAAARACQGFCRAELDVFRAVLGDDCAVERVEHILSGARRCAYRITPRAVVTRDGVSV